MIRGFLPYGGGGGGNNVDPTFNNENEHNAYWIKKVLEQGKAQYPQFYSKYFEALNAGNQSEALSYIAAMGGIPKFTAPKAQPQQPQAPSRILDIGQGMPNVGGYRYDAGQGKPALGSITNRRRRRLR